MHIPTIRPEWRTSTVVALCQGMREAQDFGAMPILADALQDAGCGDEALLQVLRFPNDSKSYPEDAAIVAIILSDANSASVRWMLNFATHFDGGMYEDRNSREWTYGDFIYAAQNFLRSGDYITGGSEMEGEYVPDVFWDHYEAITGNRVNETRRGNFFSCSC